MPYNIESALWLADRADPRNGFVLVAGWCFVDRQWYPVEDDSGAAPAVIDIAVATDAGVEVFRDLRPIEPRGDVNAAFPGSPPDCGFHFVLPVRGAPIGNAIELKVRHNGRSGVTIRVKNVLNCSDTAAVGEALGIGPAMLGKLDNLLLNEHERLAHATVKRSKPISMYVDPSFNCNLHCPHCISENLREKRFQRPVMKQDMFEHILEVYGPNLIRVTFALWGEPTLNRRLPEFVRKIKGHGAFAEMSTNLSVPLTDARLDDLVSAGFDEIRLSIDGATQAAYEIYRVGGSLELVLHNVRRMVAAKRRMGLRTPRFKWQFLEWPWNEHEIDEARRMATEIGVDLFYTIPGDPWRLELEQRARRPQDDAAAMDPKLRQRMRDARAARLRNRHAIGCDFLDHTMAVNSDGTVHPCCYIVEPKDAVGHILDDAGGGGEPFNSPAVVKLRQFVKDLAGESDTGPTPCANCGLLADGHIRDHLGLGDALTILKHGIIDAA